MPSPRPLVALELATALSAGCTSAAHPPSSSTSIDTSTDLVASIRAKAVAIPDDIVVADSSDPTRQYVVRQMEISEYLAVISDPGNLDLGPALALDPTAVPGYSPTGLAATVPDAALKYVEGVPVQ